MDGAIQVHQGWLQMAVLGVGILVWGWRIINSLEERIDRKLDKIHDRLSDLEKGQVRLEGRMDKLEGRMDNLQGRMDKLETKLDAGPGGMAAFMAGFKQLTIPFPSTAPAIEPTTE